MAVALVCGCWSIGECEMEMESCETVMSGPHSQGALRCRAGILQRPEASTQSSWPLELGASSWNQNTIFDVEPR